MKMKKLRKILVTAYAINPYKGSEDGTGWNICKQMARKNRLIIITRKNNREEIERYMAENPDPIYANMEFGYFDLPKWAMNWKKKIGERGYVLYFQLWQLLMPVYIWRRNYRFDIAHSLNFHSDSHAHFLWVFNKPTVWGPVGHHPVVPNSFIRKYGKLAYLKDRLYGSVKWMMKNLNPFFRLALAKTDLIFVINSEVREKINANPSKVVVLPAVAAEWPKDRAKSTDKFTILSVGRFVAMKGFDLCIKSFARFYNGLDEASKDKVELVLVGKGEEEARLKAMVAALKLEHCIHFNSWVSKEELAKIYGRSGVFFFPSHEGAGMVIPEAMSYGLPIVCFDNVGPGELAMNSAIKVPYTNYQASVQAFSQALDKLFRDKKKYKELENNALYNFYQYYTWERKGLFIQRAFRNYLKTVS